MIAYLSLVVSQIQLNNVLFVSQESQGLRFLQLLNLPSQVLQQMVIIFLIRFLHLLNLMMQNLLVNLLKHLIFHFFLRSIASAFFSLLLKPANQFFFKIRKGLIVPPYFKFPNYRSNVTQ